MKKQIAIIVSALLAAMPISGSAECVAETQNTSVNNVRCALSYGLISDSFAQSCEDIKELINSSLCGGSAVTDGNLSEILDEWFSEHKDCNSSPSCVIQKPADGQPDSGQPDNSEEQAPDYQEPDSEQPDTDYPDAELPDDNLPEVEFPETEPPAEEIPDYEQPDKPEAELPGVDLPDNSGGEENGSGNTDSDELSGIENAAYIREVLRLVNENRAKYGLAALKTDAELCRAASTRAVETVKSFSHTRPNGSSCFTVLDEMGYSYRSAGENIAMGQSSPEEVVRAWMNSEGHRANILSSEFTKIGVGCHSSGSTLYWEQMFAS